MGARQASLACKISALLLQVVGAAAVHCIKSGIATSGEVGRSLHAHGQPAAFGLQPGYLFGRDMVGLGAQVLAGCLRSISLEPGVNSKCCSQWPQDLSDIQWRGFRQGLPLMVLLFGAFAAVSNLASHHSLKLLAAKVSSADSAALYCPAADRVFAPCCSYREGFHRAGGPSSS